MTPIEKVLSKMTTAKQSGSGWMARCPAHDDSRASLSVSQGDDGKVLIKCHAGCATGDVLNKVGLTFEDLFPSGDTTPSPAPRKAEPKGKCYSTANNALQDLILRLGNPRATWTYQNAQGDHVGIVVRWDRPDGKDFRPIAKHPDGWHITAMTEPRPLYRLPELLDAKLVVLSEGEKAADFAHSLGFISTTSSGGSGAANKTDWQPLAGKEVWIFPDLDIPGRKYAYEVAGILLALDPSTIVKIIDLPGLPDAGDIVDWIKAHGEAAEPDGMRAEIETIAQSVEAERIFHDDQLGEFLSFPVDALPRLLRDFVVAGAKAIGCDTSYIALPLLVMLASAIGNTRRLELKRGWTVPAILWGAIVGDSGTSKSPACKLVLNPIKKRQERVLKEQEQADKKYEAELAIWEKNHSEWKRSKKSNADPPDKPVPPPRQRCIVSDITIEALAIILQFNPRGLLLFRDEFVGWFGSFDRYSKNGKTGSDSSNWLSIFNAESIVCDRKTGIPPTIFVPKAAVSIVGGIQPGILKKSLGNEHRESGLLARLLLVWPPRQAKRWTEADIDPKSEEELARLVDRLFELDAPVDENDHLKPVIVRLTQDAKSEWTAYFNAHGEEQKELTGDLAAAWSKLEEYAARLALVIHCVRVATGECTDDSCLDAISMKAGITLANWFKGETRRVYSLLDESDVDRDERRLIDWIKRQGGSAKASEVQRSCSWLKKSGEAEAALEKLVKAGWGHWRDLTSPHGGRPTRIFELPTPSTSTKPQNPHE